jgi:hypothetical protein
VTFGHDARLIAALGLGLFLAVVAHSDDWPQWRGPNRDGVWNETGILESFPAGGLKISWRAPIGRGWSSPVVAGGRVYVTDVQIARPEAKERVLCFDSASGKAHWSHEYAVDYPDWAFDPNAGGPRATPIVQDGKLFTVGATGQLFCFDAQSRAVVWEKSLAKEYGLEAFSGITPSPLIEGELLILYICGKPDACVVALDKKSGKEIWQTNTVTKLGNGSIIHLTPNRDAVFLFTDEWNLIQAQLTPQRYREIGRVRLIEPTHQFGDKKCAWTPLAYANRHVSARSDAELVCMSLAGGR